MLIDPKKLSAVIREKKRKMKMATPGLVDVDYKPDLNPMDMYNMEQQGRIEETLKTPHKINAEDTVAAEGSNMDQVGLSPDEKKRMGRLRAYIKKQDLSA